MTGPRQNDRGSAAAVATELAFLVVGGLLGGGWLDSRLGTSPLLTIVGVLCGFGAGLVLLVRATTPSSGGDDPPPHP